MNSVNGPGSRIFLLSPAQLRGNRARIVMSERATFDLAVRLRSEAVRRSARSSLPERSLLPRQARLRAGVRAAAGSGPRSAGAASRHHSDRGAPPGRYHRDRSTRCGDSPASTRSGRRAYRRPLAQSARALADGSRAGLRRCPPRQHRVAEVRGRAARSLRRAAGFPADFVGRGDMSRGGLLLRCGVRRGADLRPGRGRGAPRAAAAEARPEEGHTMKGAQPTRPSPRPGRRRSALKARTSG